MRAEGSSLGSELMSEAFRKLRLAMRLIGENLGVQERAPPGQSSETRSRGSRFLTICRQIWS